ncbi:MAG TPA: ABC transporter substrate-binding protein [Blastocatellia bacterium]|nr:ABC transporter substrate-binding protein [Blastocatellia bacterium]
MNDPRKTTIDGRKAAQDPSSGDDEAQVSSERVLEVLAQIAQGDLSVLANGKQLALAGKDRHLLLNLDGLARRLRYIVGRLQRAADSIETVVGEVLRGTQMLSAGVLDEAKSVEETSRSIAEINASMHSVGDSLQTLSNLSQSTSNSVMRMATSINQVSENADELAQFVEETAFAIEDMANTVRKVADSTEALAESAEKTVRAMEAIDNSTRSIGESVNETTMLADEVARSADSGSELVAETATSMSKIKDAIDAATETITRLGRRSDQIGEVTHVINEIADRTHLLALNAAILAAQAGTQGRGFRIVADEIKELSERTSASTREIEEVIKAVREDVTETIERVAVGGQRADAGVDLASRAAALLAEIREKTTAASDRIRLIADSTAIQAAESHTVLEAADLVRQQARGIERATGEQALTSRHIGERALHMSELTEQVRRATREQAKVSRSIAEAMEELTGAVEQIRGASDEQSAGADQVLRAVDTIKEVVSRNQTSISGINSAVDLLVREAELLNREVETFHLPVPDRGGHLRFALRASQVTLDPATMSSLSRVDVMSNIFEGLVQFGERAEIRPAVAERWDISPDGRIYTFYLREAARFHNGRRVRSEDVKYSFERQMRQNEDAAAWAFRPLVGADQFMSGDADSVAGIRVVSEQVLRLELIQPVAFFLSTLCTEYSYIVPREEVERPSMDFEIRPVGSGPFRVVEPVLGKEVQLERFANYWNPVLPYVDRLTVFFGLSAEEIFDTFLRGELDYVSDLPLTNLSELKERAADVQVLEAVQLQTRMLVFDCERLPLSDRRVRQAMCLAIDRRRFLREVYGEMAELSIGPIPPGVLGYDAGERGYDYDPDRARALLQDAGYGNGFDTEVWWPQSVSSAVECLKEDLAAVGIRAEFRYVEAEEMERGLRLRTVPIAGRDWYADYPDPDNFTYVLFNSCNRDLFISTYSNDEVDRLTGEARSVMNREQRDGIYREVTKLLLEDAPCAFLAHRRSFVAHRSDLEGVTLHLLSPSVTPKDLWFAKGADKTAAAGER